MGILGTYPSPPPDEAAQILLFTFIGFFIFLTFLMIIGLYTGMVEPVDSHSSQNDCVTFEEFYSYSKANLSDRRRKSINNVV
jgi:hypothetical protein